MHPLKFPFPIIPEYIQRGKYMEGLYLPVDGPMLTKPIPIPCWFSVLRNL